MRRVRSYYELLNVSRSASAQEIRRAYLQLMKDYHPDVAGDRRGTVDLTFVNQIYESLRDPVKRAAYDAGLARSSLPRGSDTASTQSASAIARLPRRIAWALLPTGGVALLALFISLLATNSSRTSQGTRAMSFFGAGNNVSATDNTLPPMSDITAIRERARIGATASPQQAVQMSTSCFDAARAGASLSDAQLCVVFDNAFLYSRTAPEAALPPYYNPLVVRMRHASALRDSGPPEQLMDRLWRATFSAMMANLQHSARSIEATDRRLTAEPPGPAGNQGRASIPNHAPGWDSSPVSNGIN